MSGRLQFPAEHFAVRVVLAYQCLFVHDEAHAIRFVTPPKRRTLNALRGRTGAYFVARRCQCGRHILLLNETEYPGW